MSWLADSQTASSSIFRGSSIYPYFGSFINVWASNGSDTTPFNASIWIISAPYAPIYPAPLPTVVEVDSFKCRKCDSEMRLQEMPMLRPYYERLKKARLCQSCFDKICNNLLMDDTPIKKDDKNKRIEGMLDALGEKE